MGAGGGDGRSLGHFLCNTSENAPCLPLPRAPFPSEMLGDDPAAASPEGGRGSPPPFSASIPRIPGKPSFPFTLSPPARLPRGRGPLPPTARHARPRGASARAGSSPRRGLRGSVGARRPPPREGGERPPRLAWPPLPAPHNARRSRPRRFLPPALPTPGSGSLTWLREPGEEVMGGRRRRQGKEQGKGREGGSERAEEGRARRAGAERRPNWAHGSRRLLTIPGRRAAGRLLLPFSQSLGPWGSHGLPACLPRLSASLLPLAERRRLRLSPRSAAPRSRRAELPAAGAGLVPHALAHILRGAAAGSYRRRAASRPPRRAVGPPCSASLLPSARRLPGSGPRFGLPSLRGTDVPLPEPRVWVTLWLLLA